MTRRQLRRREDSSNGNTDERQQETQNVAFPIPQTEPIRERISRTSNAETEPYFEQDRAILQNMGENMQVVDAA